MNKISKVAAYNISIQNSVALLHTNNKLLNREIKKTILFTIASKKKKNGRNVTKRVKDMYTENFKTLMKETEEKKTKRYFMFMD